MNYNPMSVDDYDAILWLEERSKELPELANAWKILQSYYDECREELNHIDMSDSPFEDSKDESCVCSLVQQVLKNDKFMEECCSFFSISASEIQTILNKRRRTKEEEWVLAKVARLYNMHLKLGHSARITYVAEQELENVPEGENSPLLKRTVLLSALLHDVGRFYQAAHYNDLVDARMKRHEEKIDGLCVDHAVAGYYYSLASALELHKLENIQEEEALFQYVSEAVAAVVVKCHQKANSSISYFDYEGDSSSLRDTTLLGKVRDFLDESYDQAKLMNFKVQGMSPKHKEFIDQFVQKIKSILMKKKMDYSVASGFVLDSGYADAVYEELDSEIKEVLSHAQGKQVSEVSALIVDIMNRKVKEISQEELMEQEKKMYQEEIQKILAGMLDYDVASSIEAQFQKGDRVDSSIRFLLSNALSMTMDADKIDILNQRALGIYNSSYHIDSFDIFPPKGMNLIDLLNHYFGFSIDSDKIVLDSNIITILNQMHPDVKKMIHETFREFDIFEGDRIKEDTSLVITAGQIVLNGEEISNDEFYSMFHEDWGHYVSKKMGIDDSDFHSLKKDNYRLLQLSISREMLDENLTNRSDLEKKEVYKRLLVSDGLKSRFMLQEQNGILSGWVLDSEDSDSLVHSSITGLLWQLNQFLFVNMRNKHSYEFIEKYHILDQIYEQYLEKDPMIADILKEYIDYCKKFISITLEEVQQDTLTVDILENMRQKTYESFIEKSHETVYQ